MIFYFNFRKRWNYKWIKWSNLKYIYSFHFEIIFLGRFKYSQVRCLELAPPWKGRSPGPHPWHPPLPGKLQLDSNRWMECQFTWNQVNYKWTGPMWVQVNRSSEKKNTPAVIQMRKKSSEMVLKWKDCQTASVSSEGCLSSKKSVKWKLNQVKTWPSERSVKCKPCQMKRLVKWLLASVKGPSSEYFVKWKVGQVNVWTSTVNLQHHHSWDMKAYIYIYT